MISKMYEIIQERDQYKAERDTLIDDLSWYKAKVSRLERENEQLKESHIKHITNMENYYKDRLQKLKEKNGELQEVIEGKNSDLLFAEDENEQLKESRYWDYEYIIKVNEENKALRLQADTYSEQWQQHKALNSEISQHIGNKPSSSTYKYFRGKLNALEIREEPTSMSVADMQPMTEVQLTKDMKDELQEVYRKAKAFDHIKVIYDKNMNEMSISDAECIEMIGNELEGADDV